MSDADWILEEPGLNPSDPIQALIQKAPYKRSEDSKGHDLAVGCRLPKSFGRWLEKIRELPGSPYDTRGDLVRDAIYLGMQVLSLRYSLSPEWKAEEQLARISARIEEEAEIFIKEEAFVKNLADLCDADSFSQAKSNLRERVDFLKSSHDSQRMAFHLLVLEKRIDSHGLHSLWEE